jgi:hypothetical protein
MNYLNYLKSLVILNDFEITEEINYQYNGETNAIVIKYLSGTNFRESTIQPIQLSIYTNDIENTKSILDSFVATYNNSPFYENVNSINYYVQQIYSTPLLLASFEPVGNNYMHTFVISSTLLISKNVSDIKQVEIDGLSYETTSRILTYTAQLDNQRIANSFINESNVSFATIKFNVNVINKSTGLEGSLAQKISLIRRGLIDIDTPFTIKLTYSDEAVETYIMRLDSSSLTSENQSLPLLVMSFTQ